MGREVLAGAQISPSRSVAKTPSPSDIWVVNQSLRGVNCAGFGVTPRNVNAPSTRTATPPKLLAIRRQIAAVNVVQKIGRLFGQPEGVILDIGEIDHQLLQDRTACEPRGELFAFLARLDLERKIEPNNSQTARRWRGSWRGLL